MNYPKSDPHWVKAEKVVTHGMYADVTVYGETFKQVKIDWSNPFMDKTKSDCLVEYNGDWLRVWWNDVDEQRTA